MITDRDLEVLASIKYETVLSNAAALRTAAKWAHETLRGQLPGVTRLAVRGTSGLAVASAMMAKYKKYSVLYVRKQNESHHGCTDVAGSYSLDPSAPYVILDDFISSGTTVKAIYEAVDASVHSQFGHRSLCVAVLLYSHRRDIDPSERAGDMPHFYPTMPNGCVSNATVLN